MEPEKRRGCQGSRGPYCALRRQQQQELRRTPAEDLAARHAALAEGGGKERAHALKLLKAAREARKNEAGAQSLRLLLPA